MRVNGKIRLLETIKGRRAGFRWITVHSVSVCFPAQDLSSTIFRPQALPDDETRREESHHTTILTSYFRAGSNTHQGMSPLKG
jgi:hypothetical protein